MIPPLLVVLPFCQKDATLASNLLAWIDWLRVPVSGLGFRYEHSILLVADSKVPREEVLSMKAVAASLFRFAEVIFVKVPDDRQSWPKGPNFMFHEASRTIQDRYKLPFLWLEPDCVPIYSGWLDSLAEAYAHCPKPFMGTMATVASSPDLPQRHLSGVAVYPPNAHSIMKEACASDIAFDYASAKVVVERYRAYQTPLIFEAWGNHNSVPTFKRIKAPGDGDNVLVPGAIPPGAVLFHRCKDGSLFPLLKHPTPLIIPDGKAAPVAIDPPTPEPEPAPLPEPAPEPAPEPIEEPSTVEVTDVVITQPRPKQQRIGLPKSKMAVI